MSMKAKYNCRTITIYEILFVLVEKLSLREASGDFTQMEGQKIGYPDLLALGVANLMVKL